jgi:hypothetical protein
MSASTRILEVRFFHLADTDALLNVRFGSLADAATMSALSPVHPDKRTSAGVSASVGSNAL